MAEKEKFLYHCDRCGELFKSVQRASEDIRCDACGEHPVRSKFAAVAEMPALDKHDKKSKHGVPGMDEADIFSMKKKQARKNWTIICLMWILGLGVIALMANRMNNKAQEAAKEDIELDPEDKAFVARKNDALGKCVKRFTAFASTNAVRSKLSHTINGSDLVLHIERYYRGNLMKNDLAKSRIVKYDLIEDGDKPKMLVLLRYTPSKGNKDESRKASKSYDFEVLFWKKGDDWLIDWPHFVRLGDMNWFRFGENLKKDTPKRFKLYAREPSTDSLSLSGYEEYKFSEAYNSSISTSQLEKSVFVKHQTTFRADLAKAFRELKAKKVKTNTTDSGFIDPPRKIRIDVTLDHQEIEGDTVMVLKEIHGFEWETPPTKDDD